MDDGGFESGQGQGMFLLTTLSRPVLGPTQPHIQWVPVALSLGIKRPGREPNYSPKSRMSGAICPLPQYAIMVRCSVKEQGQLYLYLVCIYNCRRKTLTRLEFDPMTLCSEVQNSSA